MSASQETPVAAAEPTEAGAAATIPAADEAPLIPARPAPTRSLDVLLYSDDRSVRDAVRVAVGKRPSREIEVGSWFECATPAAAEAALKESSFDLLILDGEAQPLGGLGMCRQFKHEFFECPPVIVLTGRPQDDWLAAWSYADGAVPHPIDPVVMARAVAQVAAGAASKPA